MGFSGLNRPPFYWHPFCIMTALSSVHLLGPQPEVTADTTPLGFHLLLSAVNSDSDPVWCAVHAHRWEHGVKSFPTMLE